MIAPLKPKPEEPRNDLVIAISIDRPSKDCPEGYICMTAHQKSTDPKQAAPLMEDAADGPINEETIEAVIRDLRSYVANGRKAFVNEIERDDDGLEKPGR